MYDDPEAHAEVEKALFRLQETIREVNKAKDDPKTRRLIEITWQLQDRLMFQEQVRCLRNLTRLTNNGRPFPELSFSGYLATFSSAAFCMWLTKRLTVSKGSIWLAFYTSRASSLQMQDAFSLLTV